jgi:hypothetical protein
MSNQNPTPPFKPPQSSQQYQSSKFEEATTVRSPGKGSTSQNPSWHESRSEKVEAPRASKKVKPAPSGRSVVHDKAWLCTFLLHTLAYLGVSAYINYTAVANDKQPITEDSDLGPINTYVLTTDFAYGSDDLIMVCGAAIVGLGAALVAFAVSPILMVMALGIDGKIVVFAPRWYFLAVVGTLLIASGGPLGCE